MADDSHGHSMEAREAANDRGVVSITTIPMDFNKVFEQSLDKVQRMRPLRMPGELNSLKRRRGML